MDRIIIPAESAVAITLDAGMRCRVVNTEGGQVVDCWAFNAADPGEHLSMEHSRSANYRLMFTPGDRLYSNLFRPMLTLAADTSPGYHDTLHAACSANSNRFYGAASRASCEQNLRAQMAARGLSLQQIPCPWNLFEHALVIDGNRLADEPSAAAPGDYVELEAMMGLVLVASACPSRVGRISGDEPRGAALDILGPA